ncbi:hypothetical protein LWI28_019168 [Acer negundo]|uniref:Uncharacterized protein n=1 Tax=Acer negundo TaxID=4023 RepID=A0AAD5P3K4_ACENE|nr:hypothetical protein LWI28_019168 [Acer negundo]
MRKSKRKEKMVNGVGQRHYLMVLLHQTGIVNRLLYNLLPSNSVKYKAFDVSNEIRLEERELMLRNRIQKPFSFCLIVNRLNSSG